MSLLRALILEDEWAARNYLVELLESSGLARVVAACADTEQAGAALEGTERRAPFAVDVAFVDIRLAGEPATDAGLGWIRSVASAHKGACPMRFVLTTASREHALEAYELGVIDYLTKPFTAERVVECLRRLTLAAPPQPLAPEPPRRVVARDGKSLVFVPVDAVAAFEAAEGLSYVYVGSERYEVDLSLAALAFSLGPDFVRVHRNWLVPLGAVRTLERDSGESRLVLANGEMRIPIARDRVTAVRDALMASAVGLRKLPG